MVIVRSEWGQRGVSVSLLHLLLCWARDGDQWRVVTSDDVSTGRRAPHCAVQQQTAPTDNAPPVATVLASRLQCCRLHPPLGHSTALHQSDVCKFCWGVVISELLSAADWLVGVFWSHVPFTNVQTTLQVTRFINMKREACEENMKTTSSDQCQWFRSCMLISRAYKCNASLKAKISSVLILNYSFDFNHFFVV